LKKSLETETDEERKYKIIKHLQSFKNKEKSDAVKEKEIEKRRQQKADNVKRLKEGKNPFYMKKCKAGLSILTCLFGMKFTFFLRFFSYSQIR